MGKRRRDDDGGGGYDDDREPKRVGKATVGDCRRPDLRFCNGCSKSLLAHSYASVPLPAIAYTQYLRVALGAIGPAFHAVMCCETANIEICLISMYSTLRGCAGQMTSHIKNKQRQSEVYNQLRHKKVVRRPAVGPRRLHAHRRHS